MLLLRTVAVALVALSMRPVHALARCVEAEALPTSGPTEVLTTAGASGGHSLRLSTGGAAVFSWRTGEAARAWLWVRLRVPHDGVDELRIVLDGDRGGGVWTAPITPVLRWVPLPVEPGLRLSEGLHALSIAAVDHGVELDRVCVRTDGRPPEELFPTPPQHTRRNPRIATVGDGVADDTVALQAALDALAPGDALRLPAGRFRTTAPLVLRTGDVTIEGTLVEGERRTIVFFDHPAGAATDGLRIEGQPDGEPEELARNVPELGRRAWVARPVIDPGEFVAMTSDGWGPLNEDLVRRGLPATQFRHREAFAKVLRVTRDGRLFRLDLDRPVIGELRVERSARIRTYHPLHGVVLRNLVLEGTRRHLDGVTDHEWTAAERARNANTTFVRAVRCHHCFFLGLEMAYFRRQALLLERSLDCHVAESVFRDATDYDGDSHGYGLGPVYSQGIVARDNVFRGVMRHPMYMSWGDHEHFYFRNDIVRPEHEHPWMSVSIDVHGQDDYANLIEANRITRGARGVAVGGGGRSHGNDGPWNVIRGNVIRDTNEGIYVSDHSHDTVVTGNLVSGSVEHAVVIREGSARVRVRDNLIRGWGRIGIFAWSAPGVRIVRNRLQGGGRRAIYVAASRDYSIVGNALR